MAILNPVVSKFTLSAGNVQEIYYCPNTKTNAVIDIDVYKENTAQDSVFSFALSTDSDPNSLTTVDYFLDDLKLVGASNSLNVDKVIVGQNERLYVKLTSGPDITVRLSGVEDNNAKVLKAGRLAATSVSNTNQTNIYENTLNNVSYISCSITVFNTSTTDSADIEFWISTSTTPSVSDKVLKISLPSQNTNIIESILLNPNEKIFVKSSLPNIEYFINGMVIGN